jgi:hypothetical protein
MHEGREERVTEGACGAARVSRIIRVRSGAPALIEKKQVAPMDEKQFAVSQRVSRGGETASALSPNAGETSVAPAPFSEMETTHRLFEEEVGRLPGVVRIERWGEEGSRTPTFHVYVRPDDRDAEYAVYEVKGRIYDRFPEAYLDVVVLEAIDELSRDDAPVG